jgi:hypothetical protein
MGSAGQAGLTWFHCVTLFCAEGSHILFSSAIVSCRTNVFFGCTTTVMASKATGSS